MRGRCAILQVASNVPCGLWQSEHMHEAFIHAVLGRHGELRPHGGVAAIAEFALLLRQQELRRGRMVDRVAARARHVVPRMFRALDICLFQVARMAPQAGVQHLLRRHQRKCPRNGVLPAAGFPRASRPVHDILRSPSYPRVPCPTRCSYSADSCKNSSTRRHGRIHRCYSPQTRNSVPAPPPASVRQPRTLPAAATTIYALTLPK